jgi:hypothetical protein
MSRYSLLWRSSNTQPEWLGFIIGFLAFIKKLRADYIQGMFATEQFKNLSSSHLLSKNLQD